MVCLAGQKCTTALRAENWWRWLGLRVRSDEWILPRKSAWKDFEGLAIWADQAPYRHSRKALKIPQCDCT